MDMPELVRMTDGKRVASWRDGHGYPIYGIQCDPALEDYGVSVHFEGGMGALIMAGVHSYESYGGAHGMRGVDLQTMDLESGATVELQAPEADRDPLLKSAAKALHAEAKEVDRNGVVLLYGPAGTGLALYRFFSSTDHASSGETSYAKDFTVSSRSLPPVVGTHGSLPPWFIPFLKGKSLNAFMVPPAQTATMKKQFDAAYPAAPAGARP
jgi:hypothetical protein